MKKLAIIMCAMALAIALPCIAFAAPSGSVSGDTTTSKSTDALNNADSLELTVEGADWVKVEPMPEGEIWFAPNTDTEILKSVATNDG